MNGEEFISYVGFVYRSLPAAEIAERSRILTEYYN